MSRKKLPDRYEDWAHPSSIPLYDPPAGPDDTRPSYLRLHKFKPDSCRREMPIVSRADWDAVHPAEPIPLLEIPEVPHVIITHTRTSRCLTPDQCARKVQAIQRRHMVVNGLPDIKYNFLVGGDGQVYEGRGWTGQPAVNKWWPEVTKKTLEIAYIGYFPKKHPKTKRPRRPPRTMVGPCWDLLEVGYYQDYIGMNFQLHQVPRHLPEVHHFINVTPILGIDYC